MAAILSVVWGRRGARRAFQVAADHAEMARVMLAALLIKQYEPSAADELLRQVVASGHPKATPQSREALGQDRDQPS